MCRKSLSDGLNEKPKMSKHLQKIMSTMKKLDKKPMVWHDVSKVIQIKKPCMVFLTQQKQKLNS